MGVKRRSVFSAISPADAKKTRPMFAPSSLRRTLAAALRDLEHPTPKVRQDALRDLVHHGDDHREDVVRALTRALSDADHRVRAAAALALADIQGVEALPSLLVAIEDDHDYVRQMALTALGEIGDPRARERLRRALDDERPEVRFQAVIAFGRVAPDEAEEALLQASHDDDANIRYITLRVIEEFAEAGEPEGGEARIPKKLEARAIEMLGDDDSKVRICAAILLGRIGHRGGLPILADLVAGKISTNEAEDEAAAVELTGELGLHEAIPHLERRAFGFRRLMKQSFAWQARIALARLGHARARNDILRELRALSRHKRTMAVVAAAQAGLVEASAEIERMQNQPRLAEPSVVDDALEKLSAIGSASSS